MFFLPHDQNSSHGPLFLFEFGTFICCVGAIYVCLGKVYIRPHDWRNSNRGGWIYRKKEPSRFWRSLGWYFIPGLALIGLYFCLVGGH
jgi:hypothetical protein